MKQKENNHKQRRGSKMGRNYGRGKETSGGERRRKSGE